jgi:hypothetical protein
MFCNMFMLLTRFHLTAPDTLKKVFEKYTVFNVSQQIF